MLPHLTQMWYNMLEMDIQTSKQKKGRNELPVVEHHIGSVKLAWTVPEYEKYERSRLWYILAGVAILLLLIYALAMSNFLFAVIIIIFSLITVVQFIREPERIEIKIASKGLVIGHSFYPYDEVKQFWIAYDPPTIKTLYFHFNKVLKPEISIPLKNMNPLKVREALLDHVKEDLDREDETTSDYLRRLLKL